MRSRLLTYVWAAPNSLLGLAAGAVLLVSGGRASLREGVVEIADGRLGRWLRSPRVACPFGAMTLGHVILATDRTSLDVARAHERVHVRQYERWGPLFLPAYLGSTVWQLVCGRRGYRDNWFERQAYDRQ
jgi:hypothetical protein